MEKYLTSIKDLVIQAKTNVAEIKDKAEKGDAKSCFLIGMIHLLGINTPIDLKKSSQYFGNPALANDDDVNRLLGFIAECEGNYSLAFKRYANSSTDSNAKKPYLNRVFTERNDLKAYLKKLGLPSTVQNKIITNVLDEYIKGGDTKSDAAVRLALICEDEESCLVAAQALFDTGDYYSAIRWLQKGGISENNSLYFSIKEKISNFKKAENLSSIIEVVEIEGSSLLSDLDSVPTYEGIKDMCDNIAASCIQEWHDKVSSEISSIKKKVEDEETERIKRQKAEEAARLKQQKEEENRLLRLRMAEEEKEEKKKRKKRRIDIILLCLLGPIELAIIAAMLTNEKGTAFSNFMGVIVMSAIFVVLPFMALRWLIRKIMKLN